MRVIFEGLLTKSGHSYTVQQLTLDDLEEILTLQDIVFQQLENKEILQKLSKEEFLYILEGKGLAIGTFIDKELIAIRALLVPPIDENHLGLAVGLKDEELNKVIYQEISFVHPEYRGNRLQQLLAKLIMLELEKLEHTYRYVCCTVAPFNIPSLMDKFNQHMYVKALKRIYGDKLRYIFIKDLQTKKLKWKETREVLIDHIELQKQFLKSGWIGYQLIKRNEQYWIQYGKNSD